jgi:hypothetical protein
MMQSFRAGSAGGGGGDAAGAPPKAASHTLKAAAAPPAKHIVPANVKKTKTMSLKDEFRKNCSMWHDLPFTLLGFLFTNEIIHLLCMYRIGILRPSTIERVDLIRTLGTSTLSRMQSAFQRWYSRAVSLDLF